MVARACAGGAEDVAATAEAARDAALLPMRPSMDMMADSLSEGEAAAREDMRNQMLCVNIRRESVNIKKLEWVGKS